MARLHVQYYVSQSITCRTSVAHIIDNTQGRVEGARGGVIMDNDRTCNSQVLGPIAEIPEVATGVRNGPVSVRTG